MIITNLPARATDFTLANDQVMITYTTKDRELLPGTLRDKKTGETLGLGGELFSLLLTNGNILHSSGFKLAGPPHDESLPANPNASRRRRAIAGQGIGREL